MRPPTERDQCQAKLDILIEGFMRDDWTTYRDATAWLRDFADQKKYRTRPRNVRRQMAQASPPRLLLEIDIGEPPNSETVC
jgi:hypothetical protein